MQPHQTRPSLPGIPRRSLNGVVLPHKGGISYRMDSAAVLAGAKLLIPVEDIERIFLSSVVAAQTDPASFNFTHVQRIYAFQAVPGEPILSTSLRKSFNQDGQKPLVCKLQ